ncbi:FAD-dependent protein [Melioribacteraceae bacterium 4301-Me]|uniref:NAD(P)/FAD-dependent oxidoreductase n=1 Tax=Pyranulibacter aquaticus TaxID=3163344 RepID=UPI00359A3BD8
MKKELELIVEPSLINNYDHLKNLSAQKLKLNIEDISAVQVIRKSIDARVRSPVFKLKAVVYINENPASLFYKTEFHRIKTDKKIIIVGSGPAGLFAALRLLELGIKPIVLERGKDVRNRRKDLRAIQQFGMVNSDSNYCFGEGGAGTYSDGKLYTRATKRGNVNKILNLFVQHGAPLEILIDAHPHIGSNRLPKIVSSIRETIISNGGELHFNSRVTDFIVKNRKILGVIVNSEKEFLSNAVILATGHSARDIFYLLDEKNIRLEPKPYAMGVRVEHPQELIDEIQYHSNKRHPNLPPASYNLTCQIDKRGVYSFCMCPGGIIIPASTKGDELVLNGMSVSKRNSRYANSGLVVTINENDWVKYSSFGVFSGLEFQKEIEKKAYVEGGGNQVAPAQRVTDFIKGRTSSSLPESSYIPGTTSRPLHELFPLNIVKAIKNSLLLFDRKMKGYVTEEALILAAETRTSSPIRIPRDSNTLMHIDIEGLFPAGEGAGYAGGIVSAAIDGQRSAETAVKFILSKDS